LRNAAALALTVGDHRGSLTALSVRDCVHVMRLKAWTTTAVVAVGAVATLVLTGMAAPAPAQAQAHPSGGFVSRSGSQLMQDGRPFRFSGPNIEWLGLVGYGPLNFEAGQNERFPSHYEIDDALATAKEMGATVVRAQTLGDTVGCRNCLEPSLGHFNARAFGVMDYAIARARAYGLKVIPEFQGDARAEHVGSTADIFSNWRGGASFWTDPTVIGDFENHIAHIVDHVNSYTGIAYRNDPTILGWMDCNECAAATSAATTNWVATIASFVKRLDPHHLFMDNAASSTPGQRLPRPTVDTYSLEVYPHWSQFYGVPPDQILALPHQLAAQAAAAGKVWLMSEFGWDKTDLSTAADLQTFLDGVTADRNISGDLFWALEAHTNGHGWKPIPANEQCQPGVFDTAPPTQPDPSGAGCYTNEDGNWWAFYYTGIPTLSHSAADMQARGQILRTHAYGMRGMAVPPHSIPPAPKITQIKDGQIYWQGSAGALDYSIQRSTTGIWNWTTVCRRCVTDQSDGWVATSPGYYRLIPYNLDGRPGPASPPVRYPRPGNRRS